MCFVNRALVLSATHFIVSHVGILDLSETLWFHCFILGLFTLLSIGVG